MWRMIKNPSHTARYFAIVPAAGIGSRMQAAIPKQYLPLAGQPILAHTLNRLTAHPLIQQVVVALHPQDKYWPTLILGFPYKITTVIGGNERFQSVHNALQAITQYAEPHDWILIHDAVRPCIQLSDIDKLIVSLQQDEVGGLLGIPVRDTLKQVDAAQQVQQTIDRTVLWQALTPQMFRCNVLQQALERVMTQGVSVTDDASAVEQLGLVPKMVEGRSDNIKITRPEDLLLAQVLLGVV
jgi:2-C-methyl-D-erythritol 4-phosphate cytidylyltransferase